MMTSDGRQNYTATLGRCRKFDVESFRIEKGAIQSHAALGITSLFTCPSVAGIRLPIVLETLRVCLASNFAVRTIRLPVSRRFGWCVAVY